ncbi:MAG: DUF357 domain-containing protein [archaeon]
MNRKELEKKLNEKVKRYESLTEKALNDIKIKAEEESPDYAIASEFISMARNYFSDAKYFREKKDLLNALAAFSYAYAWLDAGIKAKLLEGKDKRLFPLQE